MEDMLAELDTEEDDLQFAMTVYGLCVLLEFAGEQEKANALRERLLSRDGFWFCFSYLAAYHDQTKTEIDYCLTTIVREVSKAGLPCVFNGFQEIQRKSGVFGKNRTTTESTAFYQDAPENSDVSAPHSAERSLKPLIRLDFSGVRAIFRLFLDYCLTTIFKSDDRQTIVCLLICARGAAG